MDLPLPRAETGRDTRAKHAEAQTGGRDGSEAGLEGQPRGGADRRGGTAAASHARLQVALLAGRMGRWDWHITTGRVQWDDQHAVLWGVVPQAFDGTLPAVLACVHPDDRDELARVLHASVAEGTEFEHTFRIVRGDDTVRWMLSRGRLLGRRHDPAVLSGVVLDVTDSRAAADRASRLLEVTGGLAASITPQDVASAALSGLAAVGAVGGAVAVRATLGATDAGSAGTAPTGSGRAGAGAAGAGGADDLRLVGAIGLAPELLQRWLQTPPGGQTSPLTDVVRNGRPVFALASGQARAVFPQLAGDLARLGELGLVALPLHSGGRLLGTLLATLPRGRTLDAGDRQFLFTLASGCAQALDRALLHQREHHIAETLQRNLLPARLPDLPGLAARARYLAGTDGLTVGGDFYDLIALPGGRAALVLGDVVGKGLRAASLMSQARSTLRAYAQLDPDPQVLMTRLDALADSLLDDGELITLVYAVLQPACGGLDYVSAGHPPPLLLTPDGEPRYLPTTPGPPVGAALPGQARPAQSVTLPAASTLLLYTDGLIEQRDRDLDDGLHLLAQAAQQHRQQPLDQLCDNVLRDVLHGTRPDDIALLAVRLLPPAPGDTGTGPHP